MAALSWVLMSIHPASEVSKSQSGLFLRGSESGIGILAPRLLPHHAPTYRATEFPESCSRLQGNGSFRGSFRNDDTSLD